MNTGMNEVVIAGSGPSLDTADWDNLPSFRIGINMATSKVPSCRFVAALDHGIFKTHELFTNRILITSAIAISRADLNGVYPPRDVLVVQDRRYSILIAIQHAINIGTKKIHFVGCDCSDERAEGLQRFYTRVKEFYNNKYKVHHRMMHKLLKDNKIDYEGL